MGRATLKKIVEDKGLKVCELAKRVGVNVSRMSRFVNGWEVPPPKRRNKICQILDVTEKEIWGNQGRSYAKKI